MKARIRACILVVCLGSSAALVGPGRAWAAPPPPFAVPNVARVATLPNDLVAAAFNNDQRTDVAVANLGPDAFNGGVTVIIGNGAGGFGAQVDTDLGTNVGASMLASGDFDKDGRMDLAVLTGTTGGVGPIRILLGTGTGTFDLGQQLEGGEGTILAGELTGDTNLDVLLVREDTPQIKLFAGLGNGTFSPPRTFDVNWDSFDAELVDSEGDGDLDIVGASGGPIWTMLNQGGGNFSPQIFQFHQNLSGWQLAAADFNGDRNADVAVLNASGGDVQIGLGVGDGRFTPFQVYEDVSSQTSEVAAADWTGDGRVDLVVNNDYFYVSNIVVLMTGTGTGAFTGFTYWTTGALDPTPAQMNFDTKVDLVAFSQDPGQIYSSVNFGGGKFRAPRSTVGEAIGSPDAGDVNGDGWVDLVMVAETVPEPGRIVSRVYTHLNQGFGRFGPAIVSTIRDVETMEGAGEVILADVNEDGKLDLVVGTVHLFPGPPNVWVMLGDGTGRFSALREYFTDATASNQSIDVGDMNGDGHLDIVGHTLSQAAVLPGTGTGTFGPRIVSGSSGPTQTGTHVADFTGDGILDVLAVVKTGTEDIGRGELRLQRGNGDGTVTLIQSREFDGNPDTSQVADLNGDTRPDVALTARRGSNVGRTGMRVSLNAGGTLGAIVFYPFPPYPHGDLDAGDYDGDGDVDLAGMGFDALAIALNTGSGTFVDVALYISPENATRVAADFNGDKKPDLVSLNPTNVPLFSLYAEALGTSKLTR